MSKRLLFVEDDATFRRVLERELRGFGCEVDAFPTAEGVLDRVRARRFDCALIDLKLPGMDGMELLRALRELDPDLGVVMLTGHGAVPEAVQAMRAGAFDFITKPASLDEIEQVLRRACEHRELLEENRRLRRLADPGNGTAEILGDAPRTRELRELITRVAPSDAAVLLLGENGSGKELAARAIHRLSPRAERPFVVIHCGAIPETLVESELFGHERGAFTGADKRRVGLFEAAHGGTVFLDEVGELPVAVQPVLLRVLQFGEVRPVGGEKTRQVDVRVIAATNRDLLGEVDAGRFREDLYYRLSTLVVEIPPLRERREDVALLARIFAVREAERAQREISLDPGALDALSRHDWPGNIRELENAVSRLSVLCPGPLIRAADVERHVTARRRASADGLPTLDLHELETIAVVEAMARHKGNKRAAAAELGVALKTLYNKLSRLPPSLVQDQPPHITERRRDDARGG